MDHEAYENEMINTVNRNAAEKNQHTDSNTNAPESTAHGKRVSLFNKADKQAVRIGFRRTLLALLTLVIFFIAVCCFIAVATAPGYLAVALFFVAIITTVCAFIMLYAQGIVSEKVSGETE